LKRSNSLVCADALACDKHLITLSLMYGYVNNHVVGFWYFAHFEYLRGRLCSSVKGDSPIFATYGCAAVPAKIGTVPAVRLIQFGPILRLSRPRADGR